MKIDRSFWLFTCSIFMMLLLPKLVQEGMFVDGVTYSAIARNLSLGIGNLWNPHYTNTLYPIFYDHPPLVFGIQSVFFKIFGDGFLTERIFSLLTAMLTSLGIFSLWRLLTQHTEIKNLSWLPILFWITIPIVFWSYQNNILENTLGVFTIFSVFFIVKALKNGYRSGLLIGSFLVVFAFLSKGFVGIFPMATGIIYWIIFKPENGFKILKFNILIITLPLLIFLIAGFLFPDLVHNINAYFHQQLIPALKNQREITTEFRLNILGKLLLELSIPVILVLLTQINQFKRRIRPNNSINKPSLFFLMVGISASLPLIISLKQRSFYLTPAIPFFVIALALVAAPSVKIFIEKYSSEFAKRFNILSFSLLLTITIVSFVKFGTYSRNENKIKDVKAISKIIPSGSTLETSSKNCFDWELVAYLSRIGNLSIEVDKPHKYLLINKKENINLKTLATYEQVLIELKGYYLYEKSSK